MELSRASENLGEKVHEMEARVYDFKEKVKAKVEDLSLKNQVDKHPWASVGVAFGVGVVGGMVVGKAVNGASEPIRHEFIHASYLPKKNSWFEEKGKMAIKEFQPELNMLRRSALSGVTHWVANFLRSKKPQYETQISEVEKSILSRLA